MTSTMISVANANIVEESSSSSPASPASPASPPSIYSIEGNIGSGKSTLISILKKACANPNSSLYDKIVFVPEPVDIWMNIKSKEDGETILSKFYKDNKKYAFSFQMMAYISRVSILRKCIRENPGKIIICERSVYTDKNVFAKMLYENGDIEDVNYQIYLQWFDEFSQGMEMSGLIYVKADPEISHQRVLKRAREGENIPLEYLKNCHEYHENWLQQEKANMVLTLNADDNKNEDLSDYNKWISTICKFIGIDYTDITPTENEDDDITNKKIGNFQEWDNEMLFIC
jgi:deoxyadenosine/deoxycytidine kinase